MRRTLWLLAVPLLAVVYVAIQLLRPVPDISLTVTLPAAFVASGSSPHLPWPSSGQAAVAVQGVGQMGTSGPESPQPIASLAKMMVARLVLADHPLGSGQVGPTVTITPADVALYQTERAQNQSVLPVLSGERLTERQLLEGLLIPSGNNIADLLAGWDGGRTAFLARMNTEAVHLGMTHTHYADASGVSARTVSTASDQLKMAEADMAIPTFRHIVAMAQATLPVAGRVYNVNYYLGRGGIIGAKTGSTTAAGGCYVAAAYRTVGGHRVLVLVALLGQGGVRPLMTALAGGLRLITAAGAAVTTVQPVRSGQAVATLTAPWAKRPVVVDVPSTVTMLGWPGIAGRHVVVTAGHLGHSLAAGTRIGTLNVVLGSQKATLVLKAPAGIAAPTLWWRLTRI